MASKKHTHKYREVKQKPSGRKIWICSLPDCSHYTTRDLAAGKHSICWKCGSEFVLTKALMWLKIKPVCADCRFKKKEKKVEDKSVTSIINTRVEDIVNKLLN